MTANIHEKFKFSKHIKKNNIKLYFQFQTKKSNLFVIRLNYAIFVGQNKEKI